MLRRNQNKYEKYYHNFETLFPREFLAKCEPQNNCMLNGRTPIGNQFLHFTNKDLSQEQITNLDKLLQKYGIKTKTKYWGMNVIISTLSSTDILEFFNEKSIDKYKDIVSMNMIDFKETQYYFYFKKKAYITQNESI